MVSGFESPPRHRGPQAVPRRSKASEPVLASGKSCGKTSPHHDTPAVHDQRLRPKGPPQTPLRLVYCFECRYGVSQPVSKVSWLILRKKLLLLGLVSRGSATVEQALQC
ncbi:MAG: hypothetical protein N2Z23_09875, partial [Pyrinomonadaceae bacterium]|nr:hypothetical protein [Pyrinomonadaceae bacterium]